MMQAQFLIMAADLLLVGMIEPLSKSRSMGMPNSLWAVQPSMIVAAIPVDAHAQRVSPRDFNFFVRVLYTKDLPVPPGPSIKKVPPALLRMEFKMAVYAARCSVLSFISISVACLSSSSCVVAWGMLSAGWNTGSSLSLTGGFT
jgi:hypothetical protein